MHATVSPRNGRFSASQLLAPGQLGQPVLTKYSIITLRSTPKQVLATKSKGRRVKNKKETRLRICFLQKTVLIEDIQDLKAESPPLIENNRPYVLPGRAGLLARPGI
jgi:hypothetical protein